MVGEAMGEATANARQEVERARRAAETELDALGFSTRAALDIPAKVRRHPLRFAGLASGALFLLLRGPQRVARAIERRLFPRRRERLESILPRNVVNVIDRVGGDADAVRRNLERDFLHYLEKRHPEEAPSGRRSFWKTYDMLVGIIGGAAARELVKKFFSVPNEVRVEEAADRAAVEVAAERATRRD